MPNQYTYASLDAYISGYIRRTSTCWFWEGPKDKAGYGLARYLGKTYKAHRFIWEKNVGSIPGSLRLCHTCDVRNCVNPSHMFLGTQRDNVHDMMRKGRGNWPGCHGESHPMSKLTLQQVREIRTRYIFGLGYALAEEYGVSRMTITRVVKNQLWKEEKQCQKL